MATTALSVTEICEAAKRASRVLATLDSDTKNTALHAIADALIAKTPEILEANERDLQNGAQSGLSEALMDRLKLTEQRIAVIAGQVRDIAALPDPVGEVIDGGRLKNGLDVRKVRVPLGVIAVVYEARPNVTIDAAALCLKSGNAVILRGGSESLHSARAIHAAMTAGLAEAGIPATAVQVAPEADRAYVAAMLAASGVLDLIIPRGGRSLVERVQREARVPVLAHAQGMNHLFVHAAADPAMANTLLANSKMRRTGVCGATETLLVDSAATGLLPGLIATLSALGCRFRADAAARNACPDLPAADPSDFDTEWQDAVLNVAVVDGVDGALAHIAAHGSEHTDAIVTEDAGAAEQFLAGVSSAVALWNASTQFCDGAELGFGAEIGIATGHIHARGPVGAEQLTIFRYVVTGQGQVRP
jgi:glutamate-5-semialdehyde dehydrogenase